MTYQPSRAGDEIMRGILPSAPAVDGGTTQWPEPIPLTASRDLPAYPIDALPTWLRHWVEAEAHATQTPPDMAGMLALAAVATCCARRIEVHVRSGWREPVCIYTVIALPPGTRKSAVYRDTLAPIQERERQLAEQLAPEIEQARARHRVAEQARRRAEDSAAKKSGDDRMAADADVRDAVESLHEAAEAIPVAPQWIAGDVTEEALGMLLAEQGGRIAVMDAEGAGPLGVMMGRYSSTGSASITTYLRGHAGDDIRVGRVTRDRVIVRGPAITLAITTQPEMLRQLGERREMRGLGLLDRILWVVPDSPLGRRIARPDPMPQHVRGAYDAHVRRLLELEADDEGEPRPLRLSAAADDVIADLQARSEPRIGPGGDLEHMAGWTGKLPGAVARLAGLLHMAERGPEGVGAEVSADTTRQAVHIGDYLLAHARAALEQMGADPVLADAQRLLDWLRAQDVQRISQRDLWRAHRGRFPRAADIDPALAALADRGWIRIPKPEHCGPGRRPSPTITVHPRAADADQTSGHIGHIGQNPPTDRHSGHCGHSGQGSATREVDL